MAEIGRLSSDKRSAYLGRNTNMDDPPRTLFVEVDLVFIIMLV
jgi:hypothetical protein